MVSAEPTSLQAATRVTTLILQTRSGSINHRLRERRFLDQRLACSWPTLSLWELDEEYEGYEADQHQQDGMFQAVFDVSGGHFSAYESCEYGLDHCHVEEDCGNLVKG